MRTGHLTTTPTSSRTRSPIAGTCPPSMNQRPVGYCSITATSSGCAPSRGPDTPADPVARTCLNGRLRRHRVALTHHSATRVSVMREGAGRHEDSGRNSAVARELSLRSSCAGERGVVARRFAVVLPHLDERQRRLVPGAEAESSGRGGLPRWHGRRGCRFPRCASGDGRSTSAAQPEVREEITGMGTG